MSGSFSGNSYSVEESFNSESPFFSFNGPRRLGPTSQLPGNVKRKKEVLNHNGSYILGEKIDYNQIIKTASNLLGNL